MRKVVIATLALAGFIGVASTAQALPINCPGTALTTDREFTLDTTPSSSCLATGNGNINGNGDAIDLLGYITLDKSDDDTTGALLGALTITGTGTSGGTFSILPSTFLSYNSLVIAVALARDLVRQARTHPDCSRTDIAAAARGKPGVGHFACTSAQGLTRNNPPLGHLQ